MGWALKMAPKDEVEFPQGSRLWSMFQSFDAIQFHSFLLDRLFTLKHENLTTNPKFSDENR